MQIVDGEWICVSFSEGSIGNSITFTDTENSNAEIEITGDDLDFPDYGISIRTKTNPPSGEAIFRVMSSGGSERLRVEHNGLTSTTNDLEVIGYIYGNFERYQQKQEITSSGVCATCPSGYIVLSCATSNLDSCSSNPCDADLNVNYGSQSCCSGSNDDTGWNIVAYCVKNNI